MTDEDECDEAELDLLRDNLETMGLVLEMLSLLSGYQKDLGLVGNGYNPNT